MLFSLMHLICWNRKKQMLLEIQTKIWRRPRREKQLKTLYCRVGECPGLGVYIYCICASVCGRILAKVLAPKKNKKKNTFSPSPYQNAVQNSSSRMLNLLCYSGSQQLSFGAEIFWELFFFYGFNWRWRRFRWGWAVPAEEVGLKKKQLEGGWGGRAQRLPPRCIRRTCCVIRLRFAWFLEPWVHNFCLGP